MLEMFGCSDYLHHNCLWYMLNIQVRGGPSPCVLNLTIGIGGGAGICILCRIPKFENCSLKNTSNKKALLWPFSWWFIPYCQKKKKGRTKCGGLGGCLFVFHHAHGMQKFPGQGLNLHHGSNPSYSSDNTGSFTCWVTREFKTLI